MNGINDVESLLREGIGLDAATVGQAALQRAVTSRMQAAGIDDPTVFARLVRNDTAARDGLVEEVEEGKEGEGEEEVVEEVEEVVEEVEEVVVEVVE